MIDIVEWPDDTSDTLVYRFERHGNEIKYNARLIVREGQVAQSGQLTRDSLVWKQGLTAWTAAGQLPEFLPLFGAAPPPVPTA